MVMGAWFACPAVGEEAGGSSRWTVLPMLAGALRAMATGSSALRVLVVDDEPLMRWAIAETLTALGYSVVEAEDGQSAVRTLAEAPKPIDVIVLDCRLPDSDDLALLATIRSLAPASQVIVMTAYGTSDITKRALDLARTAS